MIVHVGSDNIVKNIIVGSDLSAVSDEVSSFPNDTFVVAPDGNPVCVGETWDSTAKKTKDSQPFASWTWSDSEWNWQPPIDLPSDSITDDQWWEWDESAYQADTADPKTEGWVLQTETPPT